MSLEPPDLELRLYSVTSMIAALSLIREPFSIVCSSLTCIASMVTDLALLPAGSVWTGTAYLQPLIGHVEVVLAHLNGNEDWKEGQCLGLYILHN